MSDERGGFGRPPMSRRAFLAATVAAAAAACSAEPGPAPGSADNSSEGGVADPAQSTTTEVPIALEPPATDLSSTPFLLGVASGDPTPAAVILWTRLTLAPDTPGGGMPGDAVDVLWEVATDESFNSIVASGIEPALPQLAHSLHIDAQGLEPNTTYAYRFRLGDYVSPVGSTRTLPALDSNVADVRFGFSSCQHFEQGYYAAHRHLANEELDFFVWLGDYIYEYGPTATPFDSGDNPPRVHNSDEIMTLNDYRQRYAQYRGDEDLQRHHAQWPWIITWDDHEVENDHAGANNEGGLSPEAFLQRRYAAYQAWYEHMPVRLDPPEGADYQIYRSFQWGELLQLWMLDGRQYRDPQPVDGLAVDVAGFGGGLIQTLGPTALDPDHSLLGPEQEEWLVDAVAGSSVTWSVLGQQVFMHGLFVPVAEGPVVVVDTWDGYYANRRRLLTELNEAEPTNLVVLSGDFHSATVGDLRADPLDREGPVLGTEFMASSISSSFFEGAAELAPLVLATNPQIKFFDPTKGYCVCEVGPERWTTTYRAVPEPLHPDSGVVTTATFEVVSGVPGATEFL